MTIEVTSCGNCPFRGDTICTHPERRGFNEYENEVNFTELPDYCPLRSESVLIQVEGYVDEENDDDGGVVMNNEIAAKIRRELLDKYGTKTYEQFKQLFNS